MGQIWNCCPLRIFDISRWKFIFYSCKWSSTFMLFSSKLSSNSKTVLALSSRIRQIYYLQGGQLMMHYWPSILYFLYKPYRLFIVCAFNKYVPMYSFLLRIIMMKKLKNKYIWIINLVFTVLLRFLDKQSILFSVSFLFNAWIKREIDLCNKSKNGWQKKCLV